MKKDHLKLLFWCIIGLVEVVAVVHWTIHEWTAQQIREGEAKIAVERQKQVDLMKSVLEKKRD